MVEIEASTIRGQQQSLSIIGLPDQAIKEAGERIQAAIESCGYDFPKDKSIISLAPGDKKKRGDMRTPESPAGKPFKISMIQDASTWRHDWMLIRLGFSVTTTCLSPFLVRYRYRSMFLPNMLLVKFLKGV